MLIALPFFYKLPSFITMAVSCIDRELYEKFGDDGIEARRTKIDCLFATYQRIYGFDGGEC